MTFFFSQISPHGEHQEFAIFVGPDPTKKCLGVTRGMSRHLEQRGEPVHVRVSALHAVSQSQSCHALQLGRAQCDDSCLWLEPFWNCDGGQAVLIPLGGGVEMEQCKQPPVESEDALLWKVGQALLPLVGGLQPRLPSSILVATQVES